MKIERVLASGAAAGLLCLLMAGQAFSQVNSSISGTVEDASRALIPGVSVTAVNTQTGIESRTISNEAGAYSFAALIPGVYNVTATLPGFRPHGYNEVQLSAAVTVRLNFTLQVGDVATTLDVTVSADTLLTESSPSIGEVLPQAKINSLPIVGNDILDLVRILPGFRESDGGSQFDTFAGVPAATVNTTRDGLSVTDGRFNNGIFSTTTLNPDLVGEVRLILTPVDAEYGRGNGQIQITTRSGTNRYTGSAVWNVQNTKLNPNTWANNRNVDATGAWSPTEPNWRNNHEYSIAYGGPIIRNKTFFYALWDQNINRTRTIVDGNVLTDTARLGIFRYFDGWNPANYGRTMTATPTSATTRIAPAVDAAGNPVAPTLNPNGTPYSGAGLMCFSVFGTMRLDTNGGMVPFTPADCSGGTIINPVGQAFWDSDRATVDSTGYIFNALLKNMPQANYFGAPNTGDANSDGLNTANVRWLRARNGNSGAGTTFGTGRDFDRTQFNIKIDHNFSTNHKFNGSYTLERNASEETQSNWPGGFAGDIKRRPHVLSTNFTSTLGSNLVNEARFGMRFNQTDGRRPFQTGNPEVEEIMNLVTAGADPGITRNVGAVYPLVVGPSGIGSGGFGGANLPYNFSGSHSLFSTGGSDNGNRSILYSYADTVSWTKGAHAFRFGVEYRPTSSRGYSNIPEQFPHVYGGQGAIVSPLSSGNTGALASLATALTTTRTSAASLLYLLSGSVDSVAMAYWIDSFADVEEAKWQSIVTNPKIFRTIIANEASAFFKDDWKITRNLTLNLGARWEYYGSPYIEEGFTSAVRDLGVGVFGVGRSPAGIFDTWLQPGADPVFLSGYGNGVAAANALQCTQGVAQAGLPTSSCNPSFLTELEFVGPNSPNPDKKAIPADWKNLGPAVGFAYQVPWLAKYRTTVRGGYSLTYGGAGRNNSTIQGGTQQILGSALGATSSLSTRADLAAQFPGEVLKLSDIPRIVPLRPVNPVVPGGTLRLYSRSGTQYAFDPNYETPYTQNFNLSVTTSLRQNMTMDIRYIGTQSKKQDADINLNTPSVYFNQELLDALDAARRGEDPLLLTQMLAGLNLSGAPGSAGYAAVGTVNTAGVYQTGAAHLRRSTTFRTNLLNGNYPAVVNSLLTTTTGTGYVSNTSLGVTPSGRVLRNGCDRIAAQNGVQTFGTGANAINLRCFPENYLITNPQISTANYRTNSGSSNYHSMQAQFTLRPTHGMSATTTYTWSKTMGIPGTGNANPLDRDADYSLLYSSVAHDWRTNGTIELPFGPNKLLFGNSTGWVARLIERWQTSLILNMSSGRPDSITALTGLTYASGATTSGVETVPDVVGPFNLRKGKLVWDGAANQGTYFGDEFVVVPDPQCQLANRADTMGFNLAANVNCGLQAIARVVPAGTAGATVIDGQTVQMVLQNPQPGRQGNLGQSTVENLGQIRFDANLSKTFRISESKSLQIRIDATNVLNHPTPALPTFSINSDNFGLSTTKTGNRNFQGQLRLTF